MHATIRSFDAGTRARQEIDADLRSLSATVAPLPGFVAFLVQDAGAGRLTAVCLFEDASTLREADRLVARWLAAGTEAARWGAGGKGEEATTGEVLYQRGL